MSSLQPVVFVDGARTPFARAGSLYAHTRADDLMVKVIRELMRRNPSLPPERIDDIAVAAATQTGDQGMNIGRSVALLSGLPSTVPGYSIDRWCAGAMTAVTTLSASIMAGAYDVVVALGVESMTRTPMGASAAGGELGMPFGPEVFKRYVDTGLPPQGIGADMIADEYGLTREDLDAFSAQSQQRAAQATAEGRFDREIVPVPVEIDGEIEMFTQDEGIRPDTTAETLANLKPAFSDDGKITAGNSSQISDGAAAVLIMSAEKAAELGLKPRARFTNFALAGTDPVTMLKGPIPVTEKIMDKAEITLDDIDLFEINEAFASVVLAWQKETGVSLDKVNVNGGAIALGHPLGCSGAKLMTTLVNELERSGGRYGFQAMCEGGGLANATIIERIDS